MIKKLVVAAAVACMAIVAAVASAEAKGGHHGKGHHGGGHHSSHHGSHHRGSSHWRHYRSYYPVVIQTRSCGTYYYRWQRTGSRYWRERFYDCKGW